MDDIAKLRRQLGLSQQATADKASVTRSIISQVEGERRGLSVNAATKASPVLGIGPGSLYLSTQLAAIKAKVEEEEITEEAAADKLLRVLRTVLDKFEDIEEEAEADELVTELEELLEAYTGKAVASARGTKPGAKTATKAAPMHAAFKRQMDLAGTAVPRDIDEGDPHRDFNGKAVAPFALDSRNLRDDAEHGFEDPSVYDVANISVDYDDEDLEGREPFTGRRVRPMDRR